MLAGERRGLFDLALAEQGRGPHGPHAKGALGGDDDADRLGEPLRFLHAGVDRAARAFARKLGDDDQRPLTARDVGDGGMVEIVQPASSASPSRSGSDSDSDSGFGSASGPSLSGCAG